MVHPQKIGKYSIVRYIATGGQATVYEARQETPSRAVALKVINPGMATPEIIRRFELETQVLGRLQHPGIARIYEAGTVRVGEQETPFFAMEFIRGQTIIDHAISLDLDLVARLELIARVCDAVHYAHQRGVIHRDLKPDNILIDETGQPKILDFGVARTMDSDVKIVTVQTHLGELIGTIPYMSPEQVEADPYKMDLRSDVYTLGVLAFELLTGRLPYEFASKGVHDLVHAIQENSALRLGAVDRGLRGDVETIVAKAMEKETTRRYQSAAEFAADINRFLRHVPIEARPPSTFYQIRKFTKRNRVLMGGIAATFLALLLGLVGTTHGLYESYKERKRAIEAEQVAEQRRIEAEHEAAKAQAVNDFLLEDMLAAPDPWTDGRSVRVVDILDRTATRLGKAFPDQPEVVGALHLILGRTYLHLGELDSAGVHMQEALQRLSALKGNMHPETLSAIHQLGVYHLGRDEFDEAARIFMDAVERRGQVHGETDVLTLESKRALSAAYYRQGRYDESENLLRQILATSYETLGSEHEDTLNAASHLGWTLVRKGNLKEAERYLLEAEIGFLEIYGMEHPDTIMTLNGLATLYLDQWRTERAEEYYRKTLEASRAVFGEEHPDTIVAMVGLGNALKRARRYDEAEGFHKTAVESYRRKLGDDHQWTLVAVNNLGNLYSQMGKHEEAKALLEKNLDDRTRILGVEHPDLAESLESLATLHYNRGKLREAIPLYEKALKINRTAFGNETTDCADLIYNLAVVHERLGEFEKAESFARELVDLDRIVYGPCHEATLSDMRKLMEILLAQKNTMDANDVGRKLMDQLVRSGVKDEMQRDILQQVANMYRESGFSDEARPWLEEIDRLGSEEAR